MAYFERVSETRFRATEHVGGAWDEHEQHIAPALGLLAHAVETERGSDLALARLSFDILGTLPIDVVEVDVKVVRPGRTIELVEATLSHGGRAAVVLRAWRLQGRPTAAVAGTATPTLPRPQELEHWDPTTVWGGGFIYSIQVRRDEAQPGRARFWIRTDHELVADEKVSDTARFVGLLDLANGMSVREDPRDVLFPNVDLTAHLVTAPAAGWVGFDTTVSFGAEGLGLTTSVIHDVDGPVGTSSQALTVRPR